MINIINEINSLKFKDKVTIMISIGLLYYLYFHILHQERQ